MIFKTGFTHNPRWRWNSPIYGYSKDKEKWSNMVILCETHEPFTPAMLEAALIHQYQSP